MSQYRHILFATDLLVGCLEIGQKALELAKLYGTRVSVLHVVEELPVDLDDGFMPFTPDLRDDVLIREATRSLDRLTAQLGIGEGDRWVRSGPTKA